MLLADAPCFETALSEAAAPDGAGGAPPADAATAADAQPPEPVAPEKIPDGRAPRAGVKKADQPAERAGRGDRGAAKATNMPAQVHAAPPAPVADAPPQAVSLAAPPVTPAADCASLHPPSADAPAAERAAPEAARAAPVQGAVGQAAGPNPSPAKSETSAQPAGAQTPGDANMPASAAPLPVPVHEGVRALAAPAAVRQAAPASAPAVAVQVARPVALLVQQGGAAGHSVIVRLDPPELGRVEVRLAASGGGTNVQVNVERPATLDLLRHDAAALHRALDQAGVAPEGRSVSVQLGTQWASGGSENRGGGAAAQRVPVAFATQSGAEAEEGVPAAAVALAPRPGLDITA